VKFEKLTLFPLWGEYVDDVTYSHSIKTAD